MKSFEAYLQSVSSNPLSKVKEDLLRKLWEGGVGFPKPWVASEELLALTGQKYFDRRLRELRDELGCDLETSHISKLGGHAWRIKSSFIASPLNREYLSTQQRLALFASHRNKCAACGKEAQPGVRGLQADHKVPLLRGGGNELSNWQPLCHNCNVGKRRACAGCTLDCNACSWAFPEAVGVPVMFNVSNMCLQIIQEEAVSRGVTVNELIEAILKTSLKGRNC